MKKIVFCSLFFVVCCIFFGLNFVSAENYIVGAGDKIEVKVYDHPDLSTELRVSGDGKIRFPLIGEFSVKGRTPSQISGIIESKLSDGYIINPQVSVSLSEYRSRKATILGEVEKPALYELRGQTTLLELISQAEGLTSEAGRIVSIKRKTFLKNEDKEEETIKIDLKKLIEEGDESQNIFVRNGDSIFIPEMKKVYVTGEVKKPASYRHKDDLTVIKVITNAGGLTDKASAKNIKIIRNKEGEQGVFEKVSMDKKIKADDVIVVPESFF